MIVGGTLILYFGLSRFSGKKNNPMLISLVLALFVIFVAVHTYFTYVHHDLLARSYNASAGLLLICSLCSWLMFKGVSLQIQRISKGTGISFAIIAVVCAVRIIGFSLVPQTSNQFLQSGRFDNLMVMVLVGTIAFLVVNLVLMVNRRLYIETEEMESLVKKNASELQAIFKTTSVGFGILVNHVFKEVNDAFCELMGYSREEMVGKESRMFFPTDEEYQAIGQMYPIIAHLGSVTIEMRFLRKDGAIINVILSISALDKNNLALGVVMSVVDITKRKNAEFKLRESLAEAQHFHEALDNVSSYVYMKDTESRYIYANQNTLKLFGCSAEELVGCDDTRFFPPDTVKRLREIDARVFRGVQTTEEIDVAETGGGRRVYLEIKVPMYVKPGSREVLGLLGISTDITERKQIEHALQERIKELRAFFFLSEIIEREGLTLEELYQEITNFLPNSWQYPEITFARIKISENEFHTNNYLESKWIQSAPVNVNGTTVGRIDVGYLEQKPEEDEGPFLKEERQLLDAITERLGRIIERKQTEQALRESEEKYSTLIEQSIDGILIFKDRLVTFANHRMSEMTGFSQEEILGKYFYQLAAPEYKAMLDEEYHRRQAGEEVSGDHELEILTKDGRKIAVETKVRRIVYQGQPATMSIIRDITDGSQRVADIVKRLLTFARQSKPIKAVVNINELIENTLKFREYVLKTNSIDVVTRLDPELPWSVVDPGQLQQVFLNLIVNAEQAMKKAHGRGTLTITSEKIENNIRITFQDDGPGITGENMGHLFEPFFTTKAPGEGTGLGLSLSRSIILEHNGKMNVESEYGHGATFIVELPIVEALPSEVETTIPVIKEEKAITNKGRILVVDDEPGVRALLDSVLKKVGYSVDTIGDSKAAMDIIDAGTIYNVILLDIRMPGISGIELYTLATRKMPSLKSKIIFITGDVMGLDIKTFLNQNNLPYLSKPFDIELLKGKIKTVLKAGQLGNDSSSGTVA
jgi:PAS domain S-box-containing protein